MRVFACSVVLVTLIGCNAVSGADGLSVQTTKGAYKATPKPSGGKTTTSPTKPNDGTDTDTEQTDPADTTTDAGTVDTGGGTVDSGTTTPAPTSTAAVECASTICRNTTPVCCDSAAAAHCAAKGNCAGYFELACDDQGDCLGGQVCCVNATGRTATCQTSCAFDPNTGTGTICHNDGQCPSGQGCFYGVTDDSNQFISDSWGFCGPPP